VIANATIDSAVIIPSQPVSPSEKTHLSKAYVASKSELTFVIACYRLLSPAMQNLLLQRPGFLLWEKSFPLSIVKNVGSLV